MRQSRGVALVVLVVVAASGCSTAGEDLPSSRPTTTAQSPTSSAAIPQVVDLPCDSGWTLDGQEDQVQTVLGVVQLPTAKVTRALQTSRDPGPPVRYFAKSGLVIRTDATFQLKIIGPADLDASLGWGSLARFGRTLAVSGCHTTQDSAHWRVYPGGYETAKTGCLTVEVSTATAAQQVQIGVGKACKGQDPPAQPSDS